MIFPKPGEFPLMTQGVIAVGELVVSFTILHGEPESPERRRALDALATARHTPN